MHLNLYPATLTTPDGELVHPVRLLTADGQVEAWRWDDLEHTGVLVGSWDAELVTAGERRTFLAPDGSVLGYDRGCGCGHPLKSWRPTPARSGT